MTASTNPNAQARRLLEWYLGHARALPWRAMPGEARPHPYRVWLSEIMLQQTTVTAVIPYYDEFLRRWPTVEALAAAPAEEVMGAWAGLGYYSRARNLRACAAQIVRQGGFPQTESELRQLPGVGEYTAAAIAAIAFGQWAVVVDANILRVVSRLYALEEPLPALKREVRAKMAELTPRNAAGDFAQAMMDLASSICRPRNPLCGECPLAASCAAREAGDPARYPRRAEKKARPQRQGRAFWIERDGAVWLVERPAAGMLGGMRALPDDGWHARADGSGRAPVEGEWEAAGSLHHGFSHFALELEVLRYAGTAPDPPLGQGRWWPLDRIGEAGLPALYRKAAERAMADG